MSDRYVPPGELTTRARNVLFSMFGAGFTREMVASGTNARDLLKWSGVGSVAVASIREWLAAGGFELLDAERPAVRKALRIDAMANAPRDGTPIMAIHGDWSGGILIRWGVSVRDQSDEGWWTADWRDERSGSYAGWLAIPPENLPFLISSGEIAADEPE